MKKIFTIVLSAILIISAVSCNKGTKGDDATEDLPLSYKTITVKQSDDSAGIQFKFVIDFPTQGPDSLVDEIKRNIFISLGDSTLSDLSEDGLQAIADRYVDESREELIDMRSGIDGDFAASYTYDGGIKVMENTDRYVTYYINTYTYTGGAHGMPYKGYVTIDKKNNKTLSLYDIVSEDKKDVLKEIIKTGIINQYYKGEAPNWEDGLFCFDLPHLKPGITTEGVIFSYEAYEIDCFAAGMPFCVIPFEDISDYMTPEAKALIE